MGIFAGIVSSLAGAVIGGAVKGAIAYKSTQAKVGAYQSAASDVKEAAEKYSGENAYNAIKDAGNANAYIYGRMPQEEYVQPLNPSSTKNQMGSAVTGASEAASNSTNLAETGKNIGQSNVEKEMNANYGYATNLADLQRQQADINYNVANQKAQTALDTVGIALNLFNEVK